VEKVKMNKFGRISYIVDGREIHSEELMPEINQEKLRMRVAT
jgi:hypothetical protein